MNDSEVRAGGAPDFGYGSRYGSDDPKGLGYFGLLQRPDGTGVMSEYTIPMPHGNQEIQVPSIVPTLTAKELETLLKSQPGEQMPRSVIEKAHAHARSRLAQGLSPFAAIGEQALDRHPHLPRESTPPIQNLPDFNRYGILGQK